MRRRPGPVRSRRLSQPNYDAAFRLDNGDSGDRTWLFDTVLHSHLEHGSVPWTNAAISG